jgi:hypothetical protein
MSAYPNPAQDELIIESSSQSSTAESSQTANQGSETFLFRAKLFDANGQLKKSGNSRDGTLILKIKDLPGGQYHLHVITDIETVSSQIIIDR